MIKKAKLVFFGTPEFAVPALKALSKEGYDICLVVTQPDKPVGRKQIITPSAIKLAAEKLDLNVISDLNVKRLKDCSPEAGVVVAYGSMIPKKILDLFPQGCLNIHPSLLPKYRGSSPIQSALLNGDKITGVTIIKLDEKMDHGQIISNIKCPIINSETAESLFDKLSVKGAELLIKTLPEYLSGAIKPKAQDDSQATFTKILKREDAKIDWRESAMDIEKQIRAYYPWPGSFMEIKEQRLKAKGTKFDINRVKILAAKVGDNIKGEIGEPLIKNGQLMVRCGSKSLIIEKLQPSGKKEMSARAFLNGYGRLFFSGNPKA